MKKAKPKALGRSNNLQSMTFRVDFQVSLSQHEGDPSDFISVYKGDVVGMMDDDSELKIGNLTVYMVERGPGRRQLRLFCEPLRPQNRATEAEGRAAAF